jgi:hypothetical protein
VLEPKLYQRVGSACFKSNCLELTVQYVDHPIWGIAEAGDIGCALRATLDRLATKLCRQYIKYSEAAIGLVACAGDIRRIARATGDRKLPPRRAARLESTD